MVSTLRMLLVGALMLCGGFSARAQDLLPPLGQDLELPAPAAVPAADEGYLGMTVDLLQADGKSVFVQSVEEGGPAARGGLRANDVILEVNGKPIQKMDDLGSAVRQPPGTRLTFKVRRADGVQRLDVVTAARPASSAAAPAPSVDELPEPSVMVEEGTPVPGTAGGPPLLESSRPQLGIGVTDVSRLSESDKRRLGVAVDAGAVISRIDEGAAAARAGLPLGGVVVSINGKRIGSAQDIVDLVRTFTPGQEVVVTYWEGDRMGHKPVRVGSSVVAVTPRGERRGALRPRRLGADRPVLNALERLLDDVLPPAPAPRERAGGAGETLVPPPPPGMTERSEDVPDIELELPEPALPPAAAPAAEAPEAADSAELQLLRKQAEEIQKQLELIRQRISELEAKRAARGE